MHEAVKQPDKTCGFSIRCPHCFNWSDWRYTDPADFLVTSDEEWEAILAGLRTNPESYSPRKMLSCSHHPDGGCPVSFQAFLCANQQTAHQRRVEVPSWTPSHAFRVYDLNHIGRLDYSVVMLTVRSVHRQKHIHLGTLLDSDLLSRAVLGMSNEISAPITVFVPRFVAENNQTKEIWTPIEAYDHERQFVPPRFNLFCEICRGAFLAPIVDDFESRECSASNCPLEWGSVRGDDSFCCREPAPCSSCPPNWIQCPAFLEKRSSGCLCYGSDSNLISAMKARWQAGTLDYRACLKTTCWAGLQERAMPIIIHEHLAGVAVTGQFIRSEDIVSWFSVKWKCRLAG
jgi:hypothetical protein